MAMGVAWLVGLSHANAGVGPAAHLQARYVALLPQLNASPFKRPLYLVSTEAPGALSGEVYAVMAYPLSVVSQAFTDPAQWCDMLILHINTKDCHALARPTGSQLLVHIGKKDFQALAQAVPVEFDYRVVTASGLIRPAWMSFSDEEIWSMVKSVVPPTRSASMGALPL